MLQNVLRVIGLLSIVFGVILGIVAGSAYDPNRYSNFGVATFLTYVISGAVSGVLFLAIAKGLDLLEEIAYNTSTLRNNRGANEKSRQASYPSTGKTDVKPSLETLSKTHTFKSLD